MTADMLIADLALLGKKYEVIIATSDDGTKFKQIDDVLYHRYCTRRERLLDADEEPDHQSVNVIVIWPRR